MMKLMTLLLAGIIFFLSSTVNLHIGDANTVTLKISSELISTNTCESQASDASHGESSHPCHFGHVGHCMLDIPSSIYSLVFLNTDPSHASYLFSYLSPFLFGIVRPPIS